MIIRQLCSSIISREGEKSQRLDARRTCPNLLALWKGEKILSTIPTLRFCSHSGSKAESLWRIELTETPAKVFLRRRMPLFMPHLTSASVKDSTSIMVDGVDPVLLKRPVRYSECVPIIQKSSVLIKLSAGK